MNNWVSLKKAHAKFNHCCGSISSGLGPLYANEAVTWCMETSSSHNISGCGNDSRSDLLLQTFVGNGCA